jgi:hypothetical protein
MKKLIMSGLLVLALTGFTAGRTFAYDHDDRGWYDNNHHHHPFVNYHNHRGYWDQRNGVRVFISI